MARTRSQDLRNRVVAAIDGGLSCRAAADRFGVSASSAIRWRQLALQHGHATAVRCGDHAKYREVRDRSSYAFVLISVPGGLALADGRVTQSRMYSAASPPSRGALPGPKRRWSASRRRQRLFSPRSATEASTLHILTFRAVRVFLKAIILVRQNG